MIEPIKKSLRDVPDFPKKGILFKDITPLLRMSSVLLAVWSQRKSPARRIPRSAKAARRSGLPIRWAMALAMPSKSSGSTSEA